MKFKNRNSYIGGSDWGTILGVNPYKKRIELVLEKAGVLANTFEGNEFTLRGEKYESTVIDMFEQKTGLIVTDRQKVFTKPYEINNFFCLPLVAHIDGFIKLENAIFEAKTTDIKSKVWDEGIPAYYKAQLEFYCYLSGADKAYIAVATYSGDELIDFKFFEYIPEMKESEIICQAISFSEDVLKAKEKYGVINNGLIIQNNEIDSIVSELEEIKEQISGLQAALKPFEEKKKQIEQKLKTLIGENAGLESGLYKITLGNRITNPTSEYGVSRSLLKVEYKGG